MLRGLLLLLVGLAAALPSGLCLCGHHADDPAEHHDECLCELRPTEATVPAPPAVEGDSGLSLALPPAADLAPVPPPVPRPAFRSESPPGSHPALPLYLSVRRLLI